MAKPNKESRPADDLRQLTSYLDGELDERRTQEVENRLSNDVDYRQLMQQLQQTWDALDVLPVAQANHSFTQSTMKLVVRDAQRSAARSSQRRPAWLLRGLIFVLIPAAASVGTYFFSGFLRETPNHQLAADLPVIRDFHVYNCDQNLRVDFLRQLAAKRFVFGIVVPAENDPQWISFQQPVPDLTALASFSNREKNRIAVNRVNFREMEIAEQSRIRGLQAAIQNDPDAVHLKQVLYQYYYWLNSLSESSRADILDTGDDEQRIAKIRLIVEEQFLTHFAQQLPKVDLQSVFLAMLALIERREMEIQNLFMQLVDVEENMELEFRARNLNPLDRKIFVNGGRLKEIHLKHPDRIDEVIFPSDLAQAKILLSEEAKFFFNLANEVGSHDLWTEAQLLASWMLAAYDNYFYPVPESLDAFYESQPEDVRDSLDNEHPADKQKRLQELWSEANRKPF